MSVLDKIAQRRSTAIKLASLPDVAVFVRALTAAEFIDMGERAIKHEGRLARKAIEMETALVDENGQPLLAKGEGQAFMERIAAADYLAIDRALDAVNNLNPATLETAEKN